MPGSILIHHYDSLRNVGVRDKEPTAIEWKPDTAPSDDDLRTIVIRYLTSRYRGAHYGDSRTPIDVLRYISAIIVEAVERHEEFWEYIPETYVFDGMASLGKFALALMEIVLYEKRNMVGS